jgi:WD40 repeat protein
MNSERFQYDAFISYSHAADGQLAPAIQGALHKLAKPWYKLRALNVYRDQTNLSISPELWPTIQRAISLSSYFLLFASREAVKSKWVKRELAWWLENRPVNRLFVILTDGDVVWDDNKNDFDWGKTNALPETLTGKFTSEPNFIDFRQFKLAGTYNLRDPLFLDNILSIAAPLHGKSKEEFGGEDVRQHRITKLITWSAGLLIGTISTVAIWQIIVANQQKTVAVEQSSTSLARQLAKQAELILTNDFKNLPLAVALATEALNISATAETDHAAWEALALLPELRFETNNWLVSQVKFSPDGKYLATAGQDSTARVIEWTSQKTIYQFRHTAKIWDIDFGKDGMTIATAGDDGSIKVINFRTDSLIISFKHQAAVRKVLFSPDGRYLGSASEDNTACIWDMEKKVKQSTIKHTGKVWSLAFSHNNNYLATASRDSTAILWDIKKNKLKHRLRHDNILWNVTFSMDDQYILTTSDDQSARIWQTSKGSLVKKLEHSDRVMAAAFSPDSNTLITTSWDRTIKIWSMNNFNELFTINTGGIILSVAYSPNSRYFVTGGTYTSVWNASTYKIVNRLYKEETAYNVCFSPDGEYIATADAQKARMWKVIDHTRNVMETRDRIKDAGVPIMTKGWSAVIASDANYLLTGNEDGVGRLWNLETNKVQSIFRHGRPIGTVAYASTANLIATASDSLVKLWDEKTGTELCQYRFGKEVVSLDFDNRGGYLAIGGDNGLVILETNSRKPVFMQTTKDPIYFTAFDRSGQSLLMIEAGGRLSLFNVKDRTVYFTQTYNNLMSASLNPEKNIICLAMEDKIVLLTLVNRKPVERTIRVKKGLDVAVSPNHRLVAICQSEDSTVRVVDFNTSKEVVAFRHNAAAMTAAFDSEGKHLAIGCHDGTIHIRNLETKAEVSSIIWNADDRIDRIRFSPDNKYVIAASEQYKTAAWLWRASDAISLACRLLNFRLSKADWNMYMNGRKYQPLCQ